MTGYNIYRNGSATALAQVPVQTTYTDTTVSPQTTYSYTVRARDAAGNLSNPSPVAQATTPAGTGGGAIFSDGFESGNLSLWTNAIGVRTEQAIVNTGAWAAEVQPSAAAAYATKTFASTYSSLYFDIRFNLLSQDTNNLDLLRLRTATGGSLAILYVTPTGKLALRNATTATATASATTVSKSAWHDMQIHLTVNGASSGVEVWLDGAGITALTKTASYGTTPIGQALIGDVNPRTHHIVFDDITVSTAAIG